MRYAFLVPLAGVAIAAACSSEPSASDATPDGGASSSSGGASSSSSGAPGDGGGIDADSLPPAKGDPCRGVALPADEHYVPQGMCARLVATGVDQLRQITFTPDGVLFGVSAGGNIWRMEDADGDGFFQAPAEIVKYGATGGNGNNCDVDVAGGFLYAGSATGVKRFTYAPGSKSGGPGEDVVVNQASDGSHPKHTVHVYDGYLYVHSGSAGNAVNPAAPDYDNDRSLVRRFKLSDFKSGTPFDWSTGEVVTVGLRNMVGFKRNAAGRMYGVVNGLDDLNYGGQNVHNDNPGEQVLEIAMGNRYGYPFCFTAQRIVGAGGVVAPGTQLANPDFGPHDDAWCAANSMKPATFLQAHSAPLDIQFFDAQPKGALPEKWRGGAFVAMHGSWDRQPATGYKVVWIPFDAQGNAPMPTSTATDTTFPYEIVFGGGNASGPKDGPWSWSVNPYTDAPRPVGVAISPVDGALYVSTDSGAGMLYRVGVQK